jgi:hypothetical protein
MSGTREKMADLRGSIYEAKTQLKVLVKNASVYNQLWLTNPASYRKEWGSKNCAEIATGKALASKMTTWQLGVINELDQKAKDTNDLRTNLNAMYNKLNESVNTCANVPQSFQAITTSFAALEANENLIEKILLGNIVLQVKCPVLNNDTPEDVTFLSAAPSCLPLENLPTIPQVQSPD